MQATIITLATCTLPVHALQTQRQYSSQIVETDTVSLEFSGKIMRFLLHSVFPPETCLLPPQCWATRILKHWDHCDTQINIGEGEIDTSVSRFLTSIVDLPRWLLSRYFMKRASLEAPFLLYRDWTHCAWAVCYPLSGFSLGSFGGPPGKRDYLENFYPRSRHHNTGIPANRAGSVVT